MIRNINWFARVNLCVIPASLDNSKWLVQVNPCQFEPQKMACPNEVLSDYFVKFRLSERSFANLFCENQIMKSNVLSV